MPCFSELPCVSWTDVISVDEWLKTQPWETFKEKFNNDGYLVRYMDISGVFQMNMSRNRLK